MCCARECVVYVSAFASESACVKGGLIQTVRWHALYCELSILSLRESLRLGTPKAKLKRQERRKKKARPKSEGKERERERERERDGEGEGGGGGAFPQASRNSSFLGWNAE